MRGSPPLHLVLFVIGFALLAVPLARLTFARPSAPQVVTVTFGDAIEGNILETIVRVRFAHAPLSFEVKEFGGILIESSSAPRGNVYEERMEMTIPKDGLELILTAKWPPGTPDTAVTIELDPDGLDGQSQSQWSNGPEMSEVFSFQWKS